MTHKIRIFEEAPAPEAGGVVRGLRAVITVGVWALVALAGLTVWARLVG